MPLCFYQTAPNVPTHPATPQPNRCKAVETASFGVGTYSVQILLSGGKGFDKAEMLLPLSPMMNIQYFQLKGSLFLKSRGVYPYVEVKE
jgi:hypothetical protein